METPLGTAYITVNHDDEDEPREVFVNQGKAGSDIAPLSEAIGKLASIVFRVPSTMPPRDRLREIARRLRGIGGSTTYGFGPERTRSLPDALARCSRSTSQAPRQAQPAGSICPERSVATFIPATPLAINGNGAHTNGSASHANNHVSARYTGNLCPGLWDGARL